MIIPMMLLVYLIGFEIRARFKGFCGLSSIMITVFAVCTPFIDDSVEFSRRQNHTINF